MIAYIRMLFFISSQISKNKNNTFLNYQKKIKGKKATIDRLKLAKR